MEQREVKLKVNSQSGIKLKNVKVYAYVISWITKFKLTLLSNKYCIIS